MDWSLGSIIQIGLRLIQHRAEVQAMWNRVDRFIGEAMALFPELRALMAKIAPELVAASPGLRTVEIGRPLATAPQYSVSWLQQGLNTVADGGLAVDGQLGPLTQTAIRHFQRTRGLVVDGWAGAATMAALDAELRSLA
jgi:peptidoglycan hydrolase-like protein with peptidoglycan-binding domain